MTHPKTPSVEALKQRFREAVRGLAEAAPLSVASLAVRPAADGPVEPVLTLSFTPEAASPSNRDAPGIELPPLVVGDAAVEWCEANRKELVLDVRPEHVRSEFYRPFARHGLRSVIVLPVFRDDALVGTLAVGSVERDAWTKRHLRLLQLMAAELAPGFPASAPAAAPAAAGEGHSARVKPEAEADAVSVSKTVGTVPDGGTVPTDAHVEADALGRVCGWDATAERLFGIARDEAVGRMLAVFYHPTGDRLIEAGLASELTARGRFVGRALGFDADGRAVTCEVELAALRTPSGAGGFRGRFRRIDSGSLLPREEIWFDFARVYAFANPLPPR